MQKTVNSVDQYAQLLREHESIVIDMKDRLPQGIQFICGVIMDSQIKCDLARRSKLWELLLMNILRLKQGFLIRIQMHFDYNQPETNQPRSKRWAQLIRRQYSREQIENNINHRFHLAFQNITDQHTSSVLAEISQKQAEYPVSNISISLYLGHNRIGDHGCRYLAKAQLENLTQLDIKDNRIGPEGCRELAKCSWPNLQHLNLNNNRVGREGCRELAKAYWPSLQSLLVYENEVGQEGYNYLKCCDWVLECEWRYK